MNKKRALLFDSINLPIVIFCFFLKPFFSKVFFFDIQKKVNYSNLSRFLYKNRLLKN